MALRLDSLKTTDAAWSRLPPTGRCKLACGVPASFGNSVAPERQAMSRLSPPPCAPPQACNDGLRPRPGASFKSGKAFGREAPAPIVHRQPDTPSRTDLSLCHAIGAPQDDLGWLVARAHDGLCPFAAALPAFRIKRGGEGFRTRSKSINYDVFWTQHRQFLDDRLL